MGSKFNLEDFVRENVKKMTPYSSARDEFSGNGSVFLDANENPYENGINRYPDPLQKKLKKRIGEIKGVNPENMILGNGSDEIIDLLFRAFCEPNKDNVVICTPTYGMYEVAAGVNAVAIKEVNLDEDFQPNIKKLIQAVDMNSKMLFLCSPNNPTANLFEESKVEELLEKFNGIVIVDEAYIDFSRNKSLSRKLSEYSNLVVLHTLSKAWGMAGIRLGIGLASLEIIKILNRIKPPYNVNSLTQEKALEGLKEENIFINQVAEIVKERNRLIGFLINSGFVKKVFHSDSNFVLIKVTDAKGLYRYLLAKGIIIRDRSKIKGLEQCVRISIGTNTENEMLRNALLAYDSKF